MTNTKDIINGLNDLLEKCYDAEKGFENAVKNTDNNNLKTFFKFKARQRYKFGHDIKKEIQLLGGQPDKGGSTKGDLHRFWMDTIATFTGKDEESILDTCEYGEKRNLEEYKKFLENKNLPITTRSLLISQQNEISETLREVRVLEEEMS